MSATQEAIELDLTTLPVVDTVTREVREPLTHDDYQQRSHELGALERRITSEELGLKAYSKTKRGEIETLEEERSELIRLLDRGIGRDVECDVRLDESRKLRLIVRRDTGELLAEEPFKSSDYPPPLFAVVEGGDGKPVANSRTIREAFISTLEGVGGEAVQRLHNDGLLDPTDWELEEAPNAVLPFPTTEIHLQGIASGSRAQCRKRTETAILAVDGDARSDASIVSAGRTWTILRRLLAEGYTKTELARRLGSKAKTPSLQIQTDFVLASTAAKVERLYNRLEAM